MDLGIQFPSNVAYTSHLPQPSGGCHQSKSCSRTIGFLNSSLVNEPILRMGCGAGFPVTHKCVASHSKLARGRLDTITLLLVATRRGQDDQSFPSRTRRQGTLWDRLRCAPPDSHVSTRQGRHLVPSRKRYQPLTHVSRSMGMAAGGIPPGPPLSHFLQIEVGTCWP